MLQANYADFHKKVFDEDGGGLCGHEVLQSLDPKQTKAFNKQALQELYPQRTHTQRRAQSKLDPMLLDPWCLAMWRMSVRHNPAVNPFISICAALSAIVGLVLECACSRAGVDMWISVRSAHG